MVSIPWFIGDAIPVTISTTHWADIAEMGHEIRMDWGVKPLPESNSVIRRNPSSCSCQSTAPIQFKHY